MTKDEFPYATAAAFRSALKDRFSEIAAFDSGFSLDELQRQFAYDRALARIFTSPQAEQWVLKGAGALLARLDQARHSKDIDVYYAEQEAAPQTAVDALRGALDQDLGDHFRFDVTRITALQEEAKGSRVHVTARVGPKPFCAFHIDVVVGTVMTGQPDLVAPLTPLNITGLIRPAYRTFPLADHLADKLCATIRTHASGDTVRPSTRIKDLVDIALIAAAQRISGPALRTAIVTNLAHRGLPVPDVFTVPDETVWRRGYPKVAADAPEPVPTFDEALALTSALLNPVLAKPIDGEWDPQRGTWA